MGPVALAVGLVALGWAVARGEAKLYLVLVVPVIVGTGPFALLGILLVFLGFALTFFFWPFARAAARHPTIEPPKATSEGPPQGAAAPEASRGRRWGGVVFLGPIPLVFGSDPQMTRWMLILGAIVFFALLILTIALFFV
jgi:uncharacterized protein (TIGR00304 family)